MELLLIATYTAICIAIFKLFRIPVNKWTLPTAVLGGIFMIGALLLFMNYNHPFTNNARIFFTTTPIMADVKGRVIEVPVKANERLKQGDVLYRIDPKPYQFEVNKRRAALAEAEQNVGQLKSAYDSAMSTVAEATAQRDNAQQEFERFNEGNENARRAGRAAPFAEAQVDKRRQLALAAESSLQAAINKAEQSRLAYQSQIGGVNTQVAQLQAALADAEFNLEQTTVRAPGPGFVTQVGLRPGMYVVPMPLRPVMVFVNGDDRMLTAAFLQNSLQRVNVGDEAEIAFDGIPGRVFKGKVSKVLDAIATGELQAGGSLRDMGERPQGGRAVVTIDLEHDMSSFNLPGGSAAQVAVYTRHAEELGLLRKILLRMKGWENYVFTEGH